MTHVLPFVIIRIAGESFEGLYRNTFDALNIALTTYKQLQQAESQHRQGICDQLHALNQSLNDSYEQNSIQNIRRDLYNGRSFKQRQWQQAAALINERTRLEILKYLTEKDKVQNARKVVAELYNSALVDARTHLQELAQQTNLQLGLPLSSESFLRSLQHYKEADPAHLSKKEAYTEKTLLKYLGRLHAKTSPFSTFTTVAVGKLSSSESSYQYKYPAVYTLSQYVTLNNYLLLCFKDVIRKTPEIYSQIPIRTNPAIEDHAGQYVYLINFNNQEVIQTLAKNPLLVYVHDLVARHPEAYSLTSLIEHLCEIVDASVEDIDLLLVELLSTGFLELSFGVSGLSTDWCKQLVALLRTLPLETIKGTELIRGLDRLEQIGQAFAPADADTRLALLAEAHETCKRLMHVEQSVSAAPSSTTTLRAYSSLNPDSTVEPEERVYHLPQLPGLTFKPSQLYFEDVISPVNVTISHTEAQGIIEIVNYLDESLHFMRPKRIEKEKLTSWFVDQHGVGGRASLLSVYNAYYRHQHELRDATVGSEQHEMITQVTDSTNMLVQRSRWQAALFAHLNAEYPAPSEEINLEIETLNSFLDAARITLQEGKGAFSAFMQLYVNPATATLAGVLNSAYFGYGKTISRFLPFLQPEVTAAIRDANQRYCQHDELYAENSDGSYFNANIHPPLLDREIAIPGGNNNQSSANCLPVADLYIEHERHSGELILFSQAHSQRVNVLDLGMQAIASRSKLYTLLNLFDSQPTFHPFALALQIKSWVRNQPAYELVSGVRFLPRVVVQHKLVLSRRSWLVLSAVIPTQKTSESDADYYLVLNLWRQSMQLPDLVFVRFISSGQVTNKRADSRKPQFIDFNNPLLVQLLQKLLAERPLEVCFEEMLPGPEALAKIDGKAYVTEQVFQWYKN